RPRVLGRNGAVLVAFGVQAAGPVVKPAAARRRPVLQRGQKGFVRRPRRRLHVRVGGQQHLDPQRRRPGRRRSLGGGGGGGGRQGRDQCAGQQGSHHDSSSLITGTLARRHRPA